MGEELSHLIAIANEHVLGMGTRVIVNEGNQTSEAMTGINKNEVLGKELLQT